MNLFSLARIMKAKYGFISQSAMEVQDVIRQVKDNILTAYRLYVDYKTAKEPALQLFADYGEPFSKEIIARMSELAAEVDSPNLLMIYNRVNKVLAMITAYKSDPDKKVRNAIHDLYPIRREKDKRERENAKSKFETVLRRLTGMLEKSANLLKPFTTSEDPIAGHHSNQQRKELQKLDYAKFIYLPAAQQYGLGSLDVFNRVLEYPDLKEKITTLINAVNNGQTPIEGESVAANVKWIMKTFNDRQITNQNTFESNEKMMTPQEEHKEEIE